AMLQAYDWPGNIRQLENAVFRASVLAEGDVLTEEEFPQIRAQVEGTVNLEAGPASATAETIADVFPQADETVAHATGPASSEGEAPATLQPRFGTLRALDERGNVRALADVELDHLELDVG
ncbi:sigma-54-dependent Fis family transcriptional regulator, partial [Mesorhizobium sp. M00.F.Ca.ET.149.01.1.1]